MQTPTTSPTPSCSKQAKSPSVHDNAGNSVKRQPSEIGVVGQDAFAEVLASLQPFLADAARFPVATRNRAGGTVDPLDADVMRIPLVNAPGKYALIDAEDYPLVMRWRWRLEHSGKYAVAGCGHHLLRMHRLVMMVGPNREVDHIDHDTLDNRKVSLRVCTHAENMWNMRCSVLNSTGVKGVAQTKRGYVATVTAHGAVSKRCFKTLSAATEWVAAKRAELHGEFARHVVRPNLGLTDEDLDAGVDYFGAEGAKARARREAAGQ